MKRLLSTFLAGALLLAEVQAFAQVRVVAPVVPVARGPVVNAINLQLAPLTAALSGPAASPTLGLTAAFQASVAPAPAVAASPAAFAARSAVVAALASPRTELPALVASLREAGGKKAEKAADSLEKIGAALAAAKPSERKALADEAAALAARFDGAAAAPGEAVDLSLVPTDDEDGLSAKKAGKKLKKEVKGLNALEDVLAAAKTQAVLVVVQGMDTAGKDGVIKHGMTGLNPAFVRVAAFKKPTAEEAAQDFLERIKKEVPKPGVIGVFNRSHYEDIIVPTVWGTHDAKTVEERYARINAFELELARSGVKVVKIFLHVSKDVQRERLQRRIDRPEKNWKFSASDLDTRKRWDDLQKAFGSILARTSTWYAPWSVIPADDKPRRDLAFTRILRKTLQRMGLAYPPSPDLKGVKIPK
jgi:PPK2 family polyphosphate:nucleotide phosphotransferase